MRSEDGMELTGVELTMTERVDLTVNLAMMEWAHGGAKHRREGGSTAHGVEQNIEDYLKGCTRVL
jgi:hypothetical protein